MKTTQTPPIPMSAQELKSAQESLGLTNQRLAIMLGVSLSTIEKWRSGSVEITGPAIVAIRGLVKDRLDRKAGRGKN